jgi:hypothetical protein
VAGNKYMVGLLLTSIVTEGLVEWSLRTGREYYYFYHFYGPMEYIFLALFFYKNQPRRYIRTIILPSIPLFVFLSLALSFSLIGLKGYQGLNTITRGILLILLSIITLFTFENDKPFYRVAVFWICTGILIYYSGTFFINGVYNGLLKKYPMEKDYFKKLHGIINVVFNYLLYIFFCIGILCSRPGKK